MDGPRGKVSCRPPSFVEDLNSAFGAINDTSIFGQRTSKSDLIVVLEMTHAGCALVSGTRDQQHGRAAVVGIRDTHDCVHVSDARDGDYAGTPGQASESFGRVGRRLLVAGVDETHTRLLSGFVERVESVAAQRRDPLDATLLKVFHKPFGSRHFHLVSVQTMSTILEQLSTDGNEAQAYSARIVKTLTNNTGPFDRWLDSRPCLLLPTQVARAVAGSTYICPAKLPVLFQTDFYGRYSEIQLVGVVALSTAAMWLSGRRSIALLGRRVASHNSPMTVLIVGCGYTGRRVGLEMLSRNARVIATTTDDSKLRAVAHSGWRRRAAGLTCSSPKLWRPSTGKNFPMGNLGLAFRAHVARL